MKKPVSGIFGVLLLASAALVAPVIAGCGGGGGGETPTAAPTEEPSPAAEETPTQEPTAEPAEETIQVDETFWHAGWKVTLGEATLGVDDFGTPQVAIEATFENLGTAEGSFNSTIVLTSGGQSYSDSALTQDIPRVPGGFSNDGLIAIQVDAAFSLDDATLIIGGPEVNQAVVPLGPTGDALVSLEPQTITASGSASAGAVDFELMGAELRADLPDWGQELEEGILALTVQFSVTPQAGIQIGQGVIQPESLVLVLPDGSAVSVRPDGRSGVNELLQGREGTTISDLSARFEVPAPAEGEYMFLVRGKYGPGGADAEGQVSFTIE